MSSQAPALPQRCAACVVRDRALCAALTDPELAALAASASMRELARGQDLSLGDDAALCGNVIDGALKLVARTADGTERIVALLLPGDFVGDVFRDTPHAAVALGPARVCLFPRRRFADALDRHPRLERLLLERTLRSVADARARLLMASGPADARVAALLAQLAPTPGPHALPLTRGDMADALGLTIETVSRALTRLREAGVVETRGRRGLEVLDRHALSARAAT